MTTVNNEIDFTRINNDTNGNPRYVCHFLNLVNDKDREKADDYEKTVRPHKFSISHLYDIAVNKSHKIGGKRFHNKQYGGGIVFQSYSLPELTKAINEVKNS
jgi:hypothetical protein